MQPLSDRELQYFFPAPNALPLYEALRDMILKAYPAAVIDVQKTQITFRDKRGFAFVWLPIRKMKGRPDLYVLFSFVLDEELHSPRIAEAVPVRPRRYTHHVVVAHPAEVDAELKALLQKAHAFAQR